MSTSTDITLALPAESAAHLTAVAEGAALGTYSFSGYKAAEDSEEDHENLSLKFVTSIADAHDLVQSAAVVARATFVTRDLVNTAPSHLFPGTFAEEIDALVADSKIKATIYDEEALADGGFGGLRCRTGSANPPRLVKLDYTRNPQGHIAGWQRNHLTVEVH